MSKELEVFNEIKLGYICGQGAVNEFALRENERENFKLIETALTDLEWLKSKLDIDFMNRLSVPEDKIRLLKIMGLEIEFNE